METRTIYLFGQSMLLARVADRLAHSLHLQAAMYINFPAR